MVTTGFPSPAAGGAAISSAARLRSGVVIGYGSSGARHARNLLGLVPELELTIVSRRGEAAGERVRVERDLDRALAARPQFAVVASDSHLHAEHVLALLREGVPCYVEKPVVTDAAQLDLVRAAIAEAGTLPVTLSGCNLRYLPSLQKLRELVHGGAAGNVARACLQAGAWLPDWRPARDYRLGYGAQAAGGVLLDLVHELDQARWLFGEFDEVRAMAGKLSALEVQAEDCAAVLLRSANGPIVMVGLDYVSRKPVRRYEVTGDKGTLTWDFHARRLELAEAHVAREYDCGPAGFDMARTYVEAMREFLGRVSDSACTTQDIHDGLRSAELAVRARAEAAS